MRAVAARHYKKISKSKSWREKHTQYVVLREHRISPRQWDAMLIAQSGRCAICNLPFGPRPMEPHVDHDHATDRIRGLLCKPCNHGIGFLRESRANFEAAIAYLFP
jgi:hypothetical protein